MNEGNKINPSSLPVVIKENKQKTACNSTVNHTLFPISFSLRFPEQTPKLCQVQCGLTQAVVLTVVGILKCCRGHLDSN